MNTIDLDIDSPITELRSANVHEPTSANVDLTRRTSDFEVPAPGFWRVMPTSHVAIAHSHADNPIALHVRSGVFQIGAHPHGSTIRIELSGTGGVTLAGWPTSVEPDRRGMSVWTLAGTVTDSERADPMRFHLRYHGVYRRHGRMWAWFSGRGAVESQQPRRWWQLSPTVRQRLAVLDLLLDGPLDTEVPS